MSVGVIGVFGLYFTARVIGGVFPRDSVQASLIKESYVGENSLSNLNPKISATSYLVADIDSGEVILEKNSSERYPIASLTKLMTAAVAFQTYDFQDEVKISSQAVGGEGTLANLRSGEVLSVTDLLHALLMQSGNDAAEALAVDYGRDRFIARMNQFARFIGADDTEFADPTGLSERNVSTAGDIFKITGYLFRENAPVMSITRKKIYRAGEHIWVNQTKFTALPNYLGGKNGYTDEALKTATAVFSVKDAAGSERRVAIIVLKSADRDNDILSILKYLRNHPF